VSVARGDGEGDSREAGEEVIAGKVVGDVVGRITAACVPPGRVSRESARLSSRPPTSIPTLMIVTAMPPINCRMSLGWSSFE
jgi:hypothetical protein